VEFFVVVILTAANMRTGVFCEVLPCCMEKR